MMKGLLGGTFDPIHNGHLAIANIALTQLQLSCVELIPCHTPAHRAPPQASAADRLQMATLAIKDTPSLYVNPIEINHQGTSYAIDTLRALDKTEPLCFLIGIDAFLHLDSWRDWQSLLEYCHLIVINRPGFTATLNPSLRRFTAAHQTIEHTQLARTANGFIYYLTVPPIHISATVIRTLIKNRQDISTFLPKNVSDYINEHRLYRE